MKYDSLVTLSGNQQPVRTEITEDSKQWRPEVSKQLK